MDENGLLDIITGAADALAMDAMSGSNWEIAAQTKLWAQLIKQSGVSSAREIAYPGSDERVDIVFQKNARVHLVEMKVETGYTHGQFGGVSFNKAYNGDLRKIRTFDTDTYIGSASGNQATQGNKFLLFIAYSKLGKKRIAEAGVFTTRSASGLLFAVRIA